MAQYQMAYSYVITVMFLPVSALIIYFSEHQRTICMMRLEKV